MTAENNTVTLAALDELLDTYGADRTRWPAAERLRFASFITTDAAAQRRVAEARALDRLLDLAPQVAPVRQREVVERIMAAVRDEQAPPRATVHSMARKSVASRVVVRSEWRAAALLAASLVIGVFLGTSGLFDRSGGMLSEGDMQAIVLDDSVNLLSDEELL